MNNSTVIDGHLQGMNVHLIYTKAFNQGPSRPWRLIHVSNFRNLVVKDVHTINASVVRLDKSFRNLAVLHGKGITLAALVAKDGGAVEGHVEGLGEFTSGVTKEADLVRVSNWTVPSLWRES